MMEDDLEIIANKHILDLMEVNQKHLVNIKPNSEHILPITHMPANNLCIVVAGLTIYGVSLAEGLLQ